MLKERITFLAKTKPQEIALQDNRRQISFCRLHEETNAIAVKLATVPSHTVLAIIAEHTIEFVLQFLGALYNEQPVAIFPSDWSQQSIKLKCEELGYVILISQHGEIIPFTKEENRYHPQAALFLLTSGSTGQSKIVQLSAKNIFSNCNAVIHSLNFEQAKDQLLFLPLYYSFGLLGQLLPGLLAGIKTYLVKQFIEVKFFLGSICIPEMWSGVPSHWWALIKMTPLFPEAIHQITHIISAGAPLSVPLRAKLLSTFPKAIVYNNYGLTEASPRVLSFSSRDPLFLSNYTGYPVGDWVLKLSKNNELLVSGNQVMLGYLDEKKSFLEKIQDKTGEDKSWLATGDIAEISSSGLVQIKGRRDHFIKVAGEKINLIEIEQTILSVLTGIEAAVVFVPDQFYGTRLVVFVNQNTSESAKIRPLLEEVRQKLLLKTPILLYMIDALPYHKSGKLDRISLLSLANILFEKGKKCNSLSELN